MRTSKSVRTAVSAACSTLAAAAGLTLIAAPAHGQRMTSGPVAAAVHFQGYDFDDALGVEAANLTMVPLAWSAGVGRVNFDFYTAWARGAALIEDVEYTLTGPVDTRVRANVSIARNTVVTLGLNVPTGSTAHDENEARVASVLATELLGFREASFGLGFGATTGIATAYRIGGTGVGFGASYRLASEFEPVADSAMTYTPGNEVRVRLGLDRDVLGNRMTAGVTYQNFSDDQVNGVNLFQAGNRWRGDVTYSFRTGAAGVWTAYLTDVWRDRGDVRLGTTGETGIQAAGTQNLLVAGLTGSWRVHQGLSFLPAADVRMLTREDEGGEGWMIGAGAGVPLRVRGFDLTPGARLSFGSVQGEEPVGHSVWGGELSLNVVWGGR